MISRNRSNISRSTEVVDLAIDPVTHYPGLKDFYFAFIITDDHSNVYELDESVFTVNLLETKLTRVDGNIVDVDSTNIPYRLCQEDDFVLTSENSNEAASTANIYCPINKDYKLSGNFGADIVTYIQMAINRCDSQNAT